MNRVVEAQRASTSKTHDGGSRVAALLALTLIALLAPIVVKPGVQAASRYALTGALADHHSVDIDGYHLAIDHAVYRGHQRSDKAPGQPILALPFYAAGRAMGMRPAAELRAAGDLGVWWSTFWSSMVPFAALVLMMFAAVRRYAPSAALPVTAIFAGSTMLLPFSTQLFGHDLAAALGFGAWLLADRARAGDRNRLLLVGLLLGTTVAVEYQAAIVAVVVFGVVACRHRAAAGRLVVGALPPMLVTAWYQWAAFGAPWRVPYGYYAGVIAGSSDGGYSIPSLRHLLDVFVSANGLLVVAPVVVLAYGAAVLGASRPGPARTPAVVASLIMTAYVVLVAGWSGTPLGQTPGPRYLMPAIPFLAVPFAWVWSKARVTAGIAALWGAFVMGAATFTEMLFHIGQSPVAVYFGYLRGHDFPDTLWTIALGRAGVFVHAATVVAAGVLLVRAARADANGCSPLG